VNGDKLSSNDPSLGAARNGNNLGLNGCSYRVHMCIHALYSQICRDDHVCFKSLMGLLRDQQVPEASDMASNVNIQCVAVLKEVYLVLRCFHPLSSDPPVNQSSL
jgi:hypothetical protein